MIKITKGMILSVSLVLFFPLCIVWATICILGLLDYDLKWEWLRKIKRWAFTPVRIGIRK
jgi:hypothetical protein